MEKHCVSLELAKQLKEAGWKKETEFWWSREKESEDYMLTYSYSKFQAKDPLPLIPAPISDEILEELPAYMKRQEAELKVSKDSVGNYWVQYIIDEANEVCGFSDKSLPNALAKCLIYLIKNNLLEERKKDKYCSCEFKDPDDDGRCVNCNKPIDFKIKDKEKI